MRPVIWGLDLREVQPRKFVHAYMWSNTYHLRQTKFIVYQLAMIFCVISESLGTAVLDDYRKDARAVKKLGFGDAVDEWSGDYIGVASFNIFNGIYVAFVFGAAFFFDLIFPERREDRGIRWAWKWCAVSTIFTTLASAIAMTVITAKHSAVIYGDGAQQQAVEQYLRENNKSPLKYSSSKRAIASIAFIWPGWLACIASTIILWKSYAFIERNGPWSTTERVARGGVIDEKPTPKLNKAEATLATKRLASGTTDVELANPATTALPADAPSPLAPPAIGDSQTNLTAKPATGAAASPLASRYPYVPGQPEFNWHDFKLLDPERGGGPTPASAGWRNGGSIPFSSKGRVSKKAKKNRKGKEETIAMSEKEKSGVTGSQAAETGNAGAVAGAGAPESSVTAGGVQPGAGLGVYRDKPALGRRKLTGESSL